ncbi:MAG: cupredoxin domain-containing protein [Caulobacteraceae bacterium]
MSNRKHHRHFRLVPRGASALFLALTLLVGGTGMVGVVAGGVHAAAAARVVTVKIANFDFAPRALVVAPGTTVTWINDDDDAHSIVADSHSFHSQALDTDEKFSFTFSTSGEYGYHCGLHPRMTGKVIVKA